MTATLCLTLAARAATPTVADAKKFLDDAETKLLELSIRIRARRIGFNENFITTDTETLSAARRMSGRSPKGCGWPKAATRFDHVKLPPDMARKMMLLKLGLTLAAPSDPKESAEVTRLGAKLRGDVRQGQILSGRGPEMPGHRGHNADHGEQHESSGS